MDAWALGIEKSAVLVGVWEDHGVGVNLEFDMTFAPGYGPHDLSTCSRMKKTALTMIVITIVIIDVVVVVVAV